MKKQQKSIIKAQAEQLNDRFKEKWGAIVAVLAGYNLLATIFTAINSERVVNDLITAISVIGKFFVGVYNFATNATLKAASVTDNAFLQALIGGIIVVLIVGVIGAALYFCGKLIISVYSEHCKDIISVVVLLVSIAVLVWFADLMPLNIVLLFILSHIVYVILRWYRDGYRESRGYYR